MLVQPLCLFSVSVCVNMKCGFSRVQSAKTLLSSLGKYESAYPQCRNSVAGFLARAVAQVPTAGKRFLLSPCLNGAFSL